jgi:hypothetical protein
MSWRFRKTFKVLPGVKLNLTSRGLSATFGAAPFSVNVGPKGVYSNVSIPGTGIWDRQRIGRPPSQPSGIEHHDANSGGVPSSPYPTPVTPAPATEIHSASTELLTSESLEQLRELFADAYNERDVLTKEISAATLEANTATRRYQKWERGFFMKRLFKQALAARKEGADTAVAKLDELQEQLRLTTIATEIALDREQADPYYRMRDTFSALSECQKIWNVLTEQAIDRIVERSSANTAVTRDPVSFSLDYCDLIQWEQKVPHLRNRTGGDMYIYPGFILCRASKQAFALIEFRHVTLTFISTQFTETETVPSDTQIVRHTWAKCNKDGSPDRRFRDNYQIPVARYGTLLFSSRDGLDVRYVCSNARSAEEFVKAWTAFQLSFNGGSRSETSDVAAAGVETDELQKSIQLGKQAFERLTTAGETFKVAHQKFSDAILSAAENHQGEATCKATLSEEDFDAYAKAVVELIAAGKELEGNLPFVPSSSKGNFRRAIQNLETSWAAFSPANDGRINSDGLVPFLDAVAPFFKAQTMFLEASAAALDRRTKKLGAQLY